MTSIYNILIGSSQASIITIKGYDERIRIITSISYNKIGSYPRVYGDSFFASVDLIIEDEQD